MKTVLYYFTGTGNSLWAAHTIAQSFPDATLIPIREKTAIQSGKADITGIIYPVYAWAPPIIVKKFLSQLDYTKTGYIFSVALNAGGVAGANVILKKIVAKQGGILSAGFSLPLISNYISWGNPPSQEAQGKIIARGDEKLRKITAHIKSRDTGILERQGAIKNFILGALNAGFSSQVRKADAKFITDDSCNGCGICTKVCPVKNITLENARPVWHHRCQQCLACMHWCPKSSINIGKGTVGKERYHHPAIKLQEMMIGNE